MEADMATKKVCFLGGTCNNSTWRATLISKLTIDSFNPVVDDLTSECQEEEIRQREICDFVLFVLTPQMTGVFSIAEVVDDSNKRPEKTVFCYTEEDDRFLRFTNDEAMTLKAVAKMVAANGATVCGSLQEVADFLNKQ